MQKWEYLRVAVNTVKREVDDVTVNDVIILDQSRERKHPEVELSDLFAKLGQRAGSWSMAGGVKRGRFSNSSARLNNGFTLTYSG